MVMYELIKIFFDAQKIIRNFEIMKLKCNFPQFSEKKHLIFLELNFVFLFNENGNWKFDPIISKDLFLFSLKGIMFNAQLSHLSYKKTYQERIKKNFEEFFPNIFVYRHLKQIFILSYSHSGLIIIITIGFNLIQLLSS